MAVSDTFYQQLCRHTEAERAHLLAAPAIVECFDGVFTRRRYIEFLTQAYHHVKHTVPLLMSAGSRLVDKPAWLQAAIAEYIEEEIGHEQWILTDIEAAGGDADKAASSDPGVAVELMVSFVYDQIQRVNPLSMLGMVHVLEGTSVALATPAAELLQEGLDLPQGAFRYLSSHGALDQGHVKHFERLVNRLDDPADQAAIVHTARRTYRLYGDMFRGLN
jgi:pyrroloquinoline quinone (PQQ) biosynthesis protein C